MKINEIGKNLFSINGRRYRPEAVCQNRRTLRSASASQLFSGGQLAALLPYFGFPSPEASSGFAGRLRLPPEPRTTLLILNGRRQGCLFFMATKQHSPPENFPPQVAGGPLRGACYFVALRRQASGIF